MKIGPITIIRTNKLEALESVVKEMSRELKLRTKVTENLLAKNTFLMERLYRYEDIK